MKHLLFIALFYTVSFAQEANIIKLVEDYPVTEKRCQIEPQDYRREIVYRYLKAGTYSFPEEGVVRYDYISKGNKYPYNNAEFEKHIIQFMFKDTKTCERFMDEFDAKTDRTAFNECKTKAHAEYQIIRDKSVKKALEKAGLTDIKQLGSDSEIRHILEISREAEQDSIVQEAYYKYLTKMQLCEKLIKYSD